ncbi:putative CipC-like antibiotic response protein [Talaromyces proteolyticus]|uniref:CipC-like antibiotic response protein n=1 Tax=Talaromyces proteolyticus TaxID=1131652 RepID=A0AAD4PZ79_9EURO|nr:putative CipC-like antibiotic response protein [Talaromyces proteolyticus]KAH8702335.1 putative CipC-like antibiotic response protein [Talaromyces proteolyticus]
MGFFGWENSQRDHERVYGDQPHEGKLSHELIAGAASFEAFKAFEDHRRSEGKPVSHAFAKEALVGLVGAEIDKLAETKGLDAYDRHEAKRHAQENVEGMYQQHYGGQEQYDPNYGRPRYW